MNKYRAKPTVVDGIRFHSKAEAERYTQLRLWEKSGGIKNLRRQPVFPIDIDRTCVGKYYADFSYWFRGKEVVEDVKGMMTPLSKFKIKCVEALYGIKIVIVKKEKARATRIRKRR